MHLQGAFLAVDLRQFFKRLLQTANPLWTNTALRPDQYVQPVLALMALRQMEARLSCLPQPLG